MTAATLYALVHRVCGHVAAVENDRATAEQRHTLIQAAGYHNWRIRVATDDHIAALLAGAACNRCLVDPERGVNGAEYLHRRRQPGIPT